MVGADWCNAGHHVTARCLRAWIPAGPIPTTRISTASSHHCKLNKISRKLYSNSVIVLGESTGDCQAFEHIPPLRDARHRIGHAQFRQALTALRLGREIKRWCTGYPRRILRRGLAPDAAVLTSKAIPLACSQLMKELGANHVLLAGLTAFFIAQFAKIFTKWYKKGVWDMRAWLDSGGMPSSHSSLCMAVTTAVARIYGVSSALFAVALAFSVIVMYDAAGVRWHAGKQAEVLNILLAEIIEGHPVSSQRLKEVLGHTPRQVLAGGVVGALIGLLFPMPLSPQPA